MIKPKSMVWVGSIKHIGNMISAFKILILNPNKRGHLGDPETDGRIILRNILKLYCEDKRIQLPPRHVSLMVFVNFVRRLGIH